MLPTFLIYRHGSTEKFRQPIINRYDSRLHRVPRITLEIVEVAVSKVVAESECVRALFHSFKLRRHMRICYVVRTSAASVYEEIIGCISGLFYYAL